MAQRKEKIQYLIPYFLGSGMFITEHLVKFVSGKLLTQKQREKALIKLCNGYKKNGKIYAGNGEILSIIWQDEEWSKYVFKK